jgi:hypothetical protein
MRKVDSQQFTVQRRRRKEREKDSAETQRTQSFAEEDRKELGIGHEREGDGLRQ